MQRVKRRGGKIQIGEWEETRRLIVLFGRVTPESRSSQGSRYANFRGTVFENPCARKLPRTRFSTVWNFVNFRQIFHRFPPAVIFHFSSLISHTPRINARVNKLKQAGKMLTSGTLSFMAEKNSREKIRLINLKGNYHPFLLALTFCFYHNICYISWFSNL